MSKRVGRRSVRAVIDQAIRENRRWEFVCLTMTVGFALTGIGVIIVGAVRGDGITSLAGAVAAGLFWPAFRAADDIRRANIAIRLMEIPLGRGSTAHEAAAAIRRIFLGQFRTRDGDVANPTQTHP